MKNDNWYQILFSIFYSIARFTSDKFLKPKYKIKVHPLYLSFLGWWCTKICIKYRKYGRYSFSFTIDCRCLANVDPNKCILKKNWPFYHFYLNKQFVETLILYFFSLWKHENKTLSKVGYFSKIAEIFSNAKNGPVCPDSWKLT